jgi:uncharacterized membrane protein HdeD (DUF308 family)
MCANLIVGIIWTIAGVLAALFHRKHARRIAVYYQTSPEKKAKFFEWCNLLVGALFIVVGIPMLADSRTRLGGFLFPLVGLASILISDWEARRKVRYLQSEKYQRFVMLMCGIIGTVVGVLLLLHVIPLE